MKCRNCTGKDCEIDETHYKHGGYLFHIISYEGRIPCCSRVCTCGCDNAEILKE